jgi:outer membrane protein assembly factor BamA
MDEEFAGLGSTRVMRGELGSAFTSVTGIQKIWKGRVVWLICLLFCAFRSVAQDAQPDTYAGFEGQHVSKVDISAKPTMDVETFRSAIVQKAGQPFYIQAIRDSVAALQKTQRFSKVQVSI